jgi:hypothetical protein
VFSLIVLVTLKAPHVNPEILLFLHLDSNLSLCCEEISMKREVLYYMAIPLPGKY